MAIISSQDLINGTKETLNKDQNFNPSTQAAPETPESPSLGETVSAAFSQENMLANYGEFVTRDTTKTDPNFNPYDHVDIMNEDNLSAYVYADSVEDIQNINEKLSKETKARDILANSGAMGTISILGASVLDPTILLPGALQVKALRAGTAVKTGIGIASGAGLGAGAVGAQEAVLQGAQSARTAEETTTNIAFATALGGVLGGAVGSIGKGVTPGIAQGLKADDIHISPTTGEMRINNRNISAEEVTLEQGKAREGVAWLNYKQIDEMLNSMDKDNPARAALEAKAKKLEAAFKYTSSVIPGLRSPIVRGLTSEFELPRRLVNDMFEHTFVVGKNLQGEALNPMETAIKQSQADLVKLNRDVYSQYYRYMGMDPSGNGTIKQLKARAKATGQPLSMSQFKNEVAKTMRSTEPHAVKEVNDAAELYRTHYKAQARKMQEQGILEDLPEDQLASYLPRFYDVDAIIANRAEFSARINKYLRKGVLNPKYGRVEGAEKWIYKPITNSEDLELQTDKIINNILGLGDESLAISEIANRTATGSSKFTKGRALLIDDTELEGFLHNDLDAITGIYTNKATSLSEFQKMLSKNGWENANDIRKELQGQYDRMLQEPKYKDNPKAQKKLLKKFKSDLDLVNDMISITMGTINKNKNSMSGKALQNLRKYNVLRMLGGVLVSSIPDMMMPVFKHGLPRTIKDGWSGYARNLRKAKLSGDEMKDFGLALELEESSILKALQDGDFQMGTNNSVLSRFNDDVVQTFGKVTGLSYWNVLGKRVAARVSGARTMRAIRKGVKADTKEQVRLRQLGIDEQMAKRIDSQFKKYGEEASGSFVSHFHEWDDLDAAKAYAQSMVKEADATTITPGMGDIPAFIQKNELFKTIFQFRSFSSSATNRLLLTGMQQKDLNTLTGMIMLGIMGSSVYMVKEKLAGREPSTDLDKLMLEGISRSGLAGLQADYALALNPFSSSRSSRWAGLSAQGVILGPSANVIGDVYSGANNVRKAAFGDKELTNGEMKQIIKLLPYSNLFYTRALFDKLKEDDK